jgi:hypothetical protein
MKSKFKFLGVVLAFLVSSVIFTKQAAAQQPNVSFQVFYDQLSPFGQWVNNPNYGFVWIPDAEQDFFPYSTDGHWIMTDYGWTWISDFSWGWAPFHYGRWDYDNYYGWFWVPDNEWGPAWVIWRRSNGYYGWEPMHPGISISVSFGREYDRNNNHWRFVSDKYFDRSDVSHYYVNGTSRDRIIRNSTVINNTYVDNRRNVTYISGPKREDVQRYTGRKINQVTIQENDRPGQEMSNNKLNIYRPVVTKNTDLGQRPAPSKVVDTKEVRRPSERNVRTQPRDSGKPENVNMQKDVNRSQNQPQNVSKPQNVSNSDNTRLQQQTNTGTRQKSNTTSKASDKRNATTSLKASEQKVTNPQQSKRTARQQATVKPSDNSRKEQQDKSQSAQDKRKNK